jgi:hypothetical protein
MAGIITTGSFPKALWPGVKAWYGRTYNDYPVQFRNSLTRVRLIRLGKKSLVPLVLAWRWLNRKVLR